MPDPLAQIRRVVAGELGQDLLPGVRAAAEEIRRRHGASIAAILFYGSCLREGAEKDRLIDFYVFTDSHAGFHGRGLHAALNALLPPNVYYIEAPFEGRKVRSKYAVLSLSQLRRQTRMQAFHSTLWARLSQPGALAYARDDAVRDQVIAALSHAIATTSAQTAPLFEQPFHARDLWTRALRESYRTEFRSEGAGRPAELYDADGARYDNVTALLAKGGLLETAQASEPGATLYLSGAGAPKRARLKARWARRRLAGKTLQVLRLMKASLTFTGGLDYILYKIEKHSGQTIAVTDWQRRHPVLAAPALAWRLYRRGAFR